MPQPASALIEDSVLDVLKNVSRRPIEPSLASDLVADLGFDSLQILEVIAELEDRFDISIPLNDVPCGYSWLWAIEGPGPQRMHLKSYAYQYRVWLDQDGPRAFEPPSTMAIARCPPA